MTDDLEARLRVLAYERWECCDNIQFPLQNAADEIERLTAERDTWKSIAAELHAELVNVLPLSYEIQQRPAIQAYHHARNRRWKKARKWLKRCSL